MQHTFFYGHSASKYPAGCGHHVFSQWHPCAFSDDRGVTYRSAEQFMMAKKAEMFGDEESLRRILASSDPRVAKALGRKVRPFDAARWSAAAYDVVVEGNRRKFAQNPDLRKTLLATGDTLLVEAAPRDRIWGIGLSEARARATPPAQWPGTNWLGRALTQVREELKSQV